MTRELFHRDLTQLQDDVLVLGSMAEKALLDAMEALRDGDRQWSDRIIAEDAAVNAKRFEIEERCITIMATQQPMAADLRALVTVLYVITEIERIADHAEGIARINRMLADEPLPRRLGYIPAMADRAVTMLRDSMKCYITHDVEAARKICNADDEVDRLQDSVYEETFRGMLEDPSTVQRNTYLLWTAHNLERVADRCTNICERVIFLVTGRMEEINVSKY